MERKYKMSYRQRVFYCPELDIHVQFMGRGVVLGKCGCGKRLRLHELKIDELVSVERIVRPFKEGEEEPEENA